jgi:hypothetical protein
MSLIGAKRYYRHAMRWTHFEKKETKWDLYFAHLQCIPDLDRTNSGEIVETVSIENEEESRALTAGDQAVPVVEDSAVKSKGEQYNLEKGSCDKDSRLRW